MFLSHCVDETQRLTSKSVQLIRRCIGVVGQKEVDQSSVVEVEIGLETKIPVDVECFFPFLILGKFDSLMYR